MKNPDIVARTKPAVRPTRSSASTFPIKKVRRTVAVPKRAIGSIARKSDGFLLVDKKRAIGKYPSEGYSRKF